MPPDTADEVNQFFDVDEHAEPSDQTLLEELATLSAIEYDRVREKYAKQLSIRVGTLDAQVAQYRGDAAEEEAQEVVEELSPWPESVDGAELLSELQTSITRHVILPRGTHAPVALWCLGTFCMDAWRVWPKVLISSPAKRCGKSTLMEAMEAVTYRPMLLASITASSLFRCIEAWSPTLLIDEADTFTKDNDELNGIINAGHTRRTANVIRSEKIGDTFRPMKFSVWCPQVIAGIGRQRDTLHDRSIHIELRRKMPGESVKKIPIDHFECCTSIRRKCIRWALDNLDALRKVTPIVPSSGNDRAQDNWTPLFAIAAVAGRQWSDSVKTAYEMAMSRIDSDDSVGPMILNDVREIFERRGVDKMWSHDLVADLNDMDERPWCEWKNGHPLTKNGLANLLRAYEIRSADIRFGGSVNKGYKREKFEDAWGRYLAPLTENP